MISEKSVRFAARLLRNSVLISGLAVIGSHQVSAGSVCDRTNDPNVTILLVTTSNGYHLQLNLWRVGKEIHGIMMYTGLEVGTTPVRGSVNGHFEPDGYKFDLKVNLDPPAPPGTFVHLWGFLYEGEGNGEITQVSPDARSDWTYQSIMHHDELPSPNLKWNAKTAPGCPNWPHGPYELKPRTAGPITSKRVGSLEAIAPRPRFVPQTGPLPSRRSLGLVPNYSKSTDRLFGRVRPPSAEAFRGTPVPSIYRRDLFVRNPNLRDVPTLANRSIYRQPNLAPQRRLVINPYRGSATAGNRLTKSPSIPQQSPPPSSNAFIDYGAISTAPQRGIYLK